MIISRASLRWKKYSVINVNTPGTHANQLQYTIPTAIQASLIPFSRIAPFAL
uniref:Uncharacterized protein n=1 Tax=Pseudomonas aeruginosa TaxID=287 RepID=B3G0Z1_PSEAI|nr:hypothetical protein PACL_0058 [Pseudomonas aeruginosa]